MHARTTLAIARKDSLDILRNKSALTILLMPIVMAVLFALLGNVLGGTKTEVLIYNPSGSAVERVVSGAYPSVHITRAVSADAVTQAFGPDGAHIHSSFAAGLIVPPSFDAALRSGAHPSVTLYTNGDTVSTQQRSLLASAIDAYARSVANPQPPAALTLATINPPAQNSLAADLTSIYALAIIMISFMVGASLVPGLLIEEKERKTLRMLMVTPASWGDIIAGKLLVTLAYQLVLTLVAMAVTNAFIGQVPVTLLFTLLGAFFGIALGLLFGGIFKTTTVAGAASGMVSFLFIIPVFFVGTLGQPLQNTVFAQVLHALPTYYLADALAQALASRASVGPLLLDGAVVLACTAVLCVAAAQLLRRQAAVASVI